MLADELDYVIGVDTHRDTHALCIVVAASGGRVLELETAAGAGGYSKALALACQKAPGRRAWAIEGTGSYGAGLARFLAGQGERVLELERPARNSSERGKSDALDALRAARCALAAERIASPRTGGERAALRALQTTREGALVVRRAGLNQLKALIVTCPDRLRVELRSLTTARLLARCERLRPDRRDDPELRGLALALRACARRVRAASSEERELKREIGALVLKIAPALLEEPGVGSITAAQLLISWSHHGRFHGEAAFAHHGGAAPLPASSGQTVRHRLDRGGDRQLNRALHTIVLARRKHHPATIAYVQRRRSEGKTTRETIRCLKRYLARHLFRLLEGTPQAA